MKQMVTVRFWNTLHRSELLTHRRRPVAFFLVWKGNGLDARSSGWKGVMVRFGSQSPRNRLKVACAARRSFQKPVTPSESLQPLRWKTKKTQPRTNSARRTHDECATCRSGFCGPRRCRSNDNGHSRLGSFFAVGGMEDD